jgi:hypothetical protein
MAESKFTSAHVQALEKAIAEKKADPGMEIITDAINAAAAGAGAGAAAAAVCALVGLDAKPADPASLIGKVPKGGFSLDDLQKARAHALKHS